MSLLQLTSVRIAKPLLRLMVVPKLSRGAIIIDDDWKPGPYPRTESERLAAAKKYNLLPEEYEPYDPEKWEISFGDYPQLPNRCFADKDPYYAWDIWAARRNYEEPMHVYYRLYDWVMPDIRPEGFQYPRHVFPAYFLYVSFALVCYWFSCRFHRVIDYKPINRVDRLYETYYHYPNSKIECYD